MALLWSLNRDCKVETITECVTDTLISVRVDTIIEYRTMYVEREVIDTLYVETGGASIYPLPIVQKHFSKEGVYDLWVSGVEPLNVDSSKVYSRVETNTVYKTITTTIDDNKHKLYVAAGLNAFSGFLKPNVGVLLSKDNNWLYGLEIGLDANDKVYYGGKIIYKIKSF